MIDTLTFTVPTMAPPACIILAFGGFRRPMAPASGGACGPASEIKIRGPSETGLFAIPLRNIK